MTPAFVAVGTKADVAPPDVDFDGLRIASVTRAGLAAMVLPEGMVGPEFRILGAADGVPELPESRMGLIYKAGRVTPETEALAQAIRETVAAGERRKAA